MSELPNQANEETRDLSDVVKDCSISDNPGHRIFISGIGEYHACTFADLAVKKCQYCQRKYEHGVVIYKCRRD